jgi:hypothetical protein
MITIYKFLAIAIHIAIHKMLFFRVKNKALLTTVK